jgi:hypothetical protein
MTPRSTALRLELAAVRLAAGVLVVVVVISLTVLPGCLQERRVMFDLVLLLLKRPPTACGVPGKVDSRAEGTAAAPCWEAASRKAAADTISSRGASSRAMAPLRLRACCLASAAMLAGGCR